MKTLPLPVPSSPASASSRGRHGSPAPISRRRHRILHAGIVALLAAAAPSTRADTNSFTASDFNMDPTGSYPEYTDWNGVLNWTLGHTPSPTDDLLFDDTVYNFPNNSQLNTNFTAGTLNFSNSMNQGYQLDANTFGSSDLSARTLTLTNGLISATGVSTNVPFSNFGIVIGGNTSLGALTIAFGTVNTTISNTSSVGMTIDANITGSGTINIFGNVAFYGAKSYSGAITINPSATLLINSTPINTDPLGTSPDNNAANLIINGGTLAQAQNTGGVANVVRLFTVGPNGATLVNQGGNNIALFFDNTGSIAYSTPGTNETLNFAGSISFAPRISDNGAGKTSLNVQGAGNQAFGTTLGNSGNTYTGTTTIYGAGSGGGVNAFLANGGVASGIGMSSNSASNVIIGGGATLYGTAGSVTDRLFTIDGIGGVGGVAGANPTTFSNTGPVAFLQPNVPETLTLRFAASGSTFSIFAPLITDNGTAKTSVVEGGYFQPTNAANSYTGSTTFTGLVNMPALMNGGVPSYMGASTSDPANVILQTAGGIQYTGSTPQSTDRLFTIQWGTFDASGTGTFTLSNPNSVAYSPYVSNSSYFILTGTGVGVFAPLLPASSGGTTGLLFTKSGTGTWMLTNPNNAYGGTTTLAGGILNVATLANGGMPSSMGAASSAAANLVFDGGTLQYTGSAPATTDRLFTFGVTSVINGVQNVYGGVIDASGSGTLTWSNTGALAFAGTNTSPAFTLTGTGTGVFNPAIRNNGTGTTTLTKTGTGQWTLGGTSTYIGATSIQGGTLVVSGSLTGTASATVGDGTHAATLSGNGSITPANGGAVTIQNGATLTPSAGNSAGLSINAASAGTAALTFQTGSTLRLSLADHQSGSAPALSDYAKLTIGTGVTVNLGGTIVTNFDGSLANGEMFSIILDGAAVSGRFANTTTAAPQSAGSTFRFTSNGMVWDINYAWNGATTMAGESPAAFEEATGGTNVALLLVSVPEPGEALLLASGCAILLGWRRRRAV